MTRPAFCIAQWRVGDDQARVRLSDVVRTAIEAGMRQAFAGPGFTILTNRPVSFFTHAVGQSILIGTVSGAVVASGLDAATSGPASVNDPRVAARQLRDAVWGAFVAVIPSGDGVALYVDPSGALPFDLVAANGVTIATDDLTPALCAVIGHTPRIDWASVVTTLVSPATATHLSHLVGVIPATPGHLYDMHNLDRGTPIWSPSQIATDVSDDDDRLRQAIDWSTAGMGHTGSAIQLSGGLDSSIVLSSLCAGNHRPTSITFATEAVGGDERGYAGLMAQHCGSPLIVCDTGRLPTYEPLFRAAPGAHPFIYGLDDAFEDTVATAARNAECDQILTGQGGDAIFFQPATPLVAIDRARALGFGPAALRPLFDDARRMRSSIWHHLLPAIADRFRGAVVPTERLAARLLTPKAQAMIAPGIRCHPWLNDAGKLPPGKRMHLTMLANSQIFHARRPENNGVAVRHPLLTQPVLEAALSIPTYRLVYGANDRGLARQLFANRLPSAIVLRRSKGEATDHYSRAALANLSFLRDMLLNGALVRENLVDREGLANLLTREQLFYSLDYRALVMHATCEAWVRYWDAA